jgi:hypothetical protein
MKISVAAALLFAFVPLSALAQQTSPPPDKALSDPDTKPLIPSLAPDKRELAVDVVNRSEPVLCAEKDNVDLSFSAPNVRSFKVEAVHPVYVNMINTDRWAYDFRSCDMSGDQQFYAEPRRVTIYENMNMWLVGITYPNFWRKGDVPVRVGDRVEHGLHLLQLWVKYRERGEEVLVLYPPDGYWRARPLPFGDLRYTAYGSSFLLGPIERGERPFVSIKEINFDPAAKSFTLTYQDGNKATVALADLDQEKFDLQVTFDKPVTGGPFLAMRSMYTTETNADVAKVAWRTKEGKGWGEAPVMTFPGAKATEIWAGRTTPSRHNLSAPDMIFSRFFAEPDVKAK